ncbi:8-oxo-dGTP diphosphatase MutT [Marinomonas sp.]|nr:8-oxo-dGTP diphosphatase MutT [Marinomonas sp.]MDB4837466.1 8-oxo-dGTP diphosphatase MutT [Marinomonas sp.]
MLIKVAVGIILRDKKVFIAFRNSSQDQGGLWEFPGGKCEGNELIDTALIRELKEECDIKVMDYQFFKTISHHYAAKQVELHFYWVTSFEGEPKGKEGQKVCWVAINDLSVFEFPEANKEIVGALLESL